jgi:hypothetical protein
MHGGAITKVKEAAEARFKEELYPTIRRLTEIRDQDNHMPSALGASLAIVNRAIGKQGAPEESKPQRQSIMIGIALGGLPQSGKALVKVATVEDGQTIEGDFESE